MTRLAVKTVHIADQIEVHHYTGDDGYPTAAVFSPVAVTTVDGRQWFLPQGVRRIDEEEGFVFIAERYDTAAMLAKVSFVRTIDPDHWVEIEPRPSLEEELGPFGLAWEREQADRAGWR